MPQSEIDDCGSMIDDYLIVHQSAIINHQFKETPALSVLCLLRPLPGGAVLPFGSLRQHGS